jgi:hypothetical protein
VRFFDRLRMAESEGLLQDDKGEGLAMTIKVMTRDDKLILLVIDVWGFGFI